MAPGAWGAALPIVRDSGDPIGEGVVESLAGRPGEAAGLVERTMEAFRPMRELHA